MSRFKLMNGVEIPEIGFGTFKITDPSEAYDSVATALKCGYTHIDTAAVYKNEEYVGKAVKNSGISRHNLFITSKVWNTDRGCDNTVAACEESLRKLRTDYLDLYLVHWPATAHRFENWKEINADTWRGMEKLYRDGKVRAIGVSNFLTHHLEPLLETAEIVPMVDQIEFHPGYLQEDIVANCRSLDILVEAYSPLGRGNLLNDYTLSSIAEKYGLTTAQVCVSWCLAHGNLPLPKSRHADRIKSNFITAELESEDIAAIDAIKGVWWSGHTADEINF